MKKYTKILYSLCTLKLSIIFNNFIMPHTSHLLKDKFNFLYISLVKQLFFNQKFNCYCFTVIVFGFIKQALQSIFQLQYYLSHSKDTFFPPYPQSVSIEYQWHTGFCFPEDTSTKMIRRPKQNKHICHSFSLLSYP